MPLIESPSNKARSENIAIEVRAGKPVKQAVAIGYAMQRKLSRMSKPKVAKIPHEGNSKAAKETKK